MNEKNLAEKTLKANMVEVRVRLYEPFYNFMKEYLAFFGSKQTVEDLCRDMIYRTVNFLYRELGDFASSEEKHLEKESWFSKWPHLGIVSFPYPEDDKET